MFDNIIWIGGAGYKGKEFTKVLTDYKSGLCHEVNAFLLSDKEQAADCAIYDKILGR